jgi:asparagine synthase (glutamine-hydrolysing)
MVYPLEGMYAFALWDARREGLLVGRDRFGEKPVFDTEQHGERHFGSELDAQLAGTHRVPELDPASVNAFLVFGYLPGPASIVRRGQAAFPGPRCALGTPVEARPSTPLLQSHGRFDLAAVTSRSTSSWPRPAGSVLVPMLEPPGHDVVGLDVDLSRLHLR